MDPSMLCQACNDMLSWKSPKWKGSYQATFGPDHDPQRPPNHDIDPDSGMPRGTHVHHHSGRAFLAAASQGCRLCLLLVSQLSPHTKRIISEEPDDIDTNSADYDYMTLYDLWGVNAWGHVWTMHGNYSPKEMLERPGFRGNFGITFWADFIPSRDQEPLAVPATPYPKVVGQGDLSLSLVRQWMEACEQHERCQLRSALDVFKTQGRPRFARIIDVRGGAMDPRLLEVDEVPTDARYMTLSHCWGDPEHQPLTLTLDSFTAMKRRIPWRSLPKTFADAITFTRSMGIRYLWIDSLCIIQDCADDWAIQSTTMCEIYSGSYLNLAATGAADSRGGLFSARDERSIQPLRVAQSRASNRNEALPGNDTITYCVVVVRSAWHREVEDTPLCRRGWIVQERALSKRCLHFGKRQLYWECPSMEASESVPFSYNLLPTEFRSLFTSGFKTRDPLRIQAHEETFNHVNNTPLFLTWKRLVETYTKGGLTNETDKLVAISGLAKALAVQSGVQYLAGLWDDDSLAGQLGWMALSPSKRPNPSFAPSWSWASTNSQVSWPQQGGNAITILGVQMNPDPPSGSFTMFKSSPLTIRGALIPGMLFPKESDDGKPKLLLARKVLLGHIESLKFTADSDSEQENCGHVCLLPLSISTAYFGVTSGVHSSGLVLQTSGVKGTLRRVGFFLFSRSRLEGEVPLREIWLLDDRGTSRTDPLEELSDNLYHLYEEIEDGGARFRDTCEEGFDWTRAFSGGFTFDLV